ncbi:MAG: adenylate/guanylate cyclase domain-containing protein [Gallionellaceae bacterium]
MTAQTSPSETRSNENETNLSEARTLIATVLFFDMVGYTKQSVARQVELKSQFNKLVSEFIKDVAENQRIILDTGDGAAIGFLQYPEDALEVALKFHQAVTANDHQDYPELKVRIGIHLGPVNIVKDMNGQSNMVGDGINDAQRIMSFAPPDSIYISRSYYDVVSRLSTKYAELFEYCGVKEDKHGRLHKVYQAIVGKSATVKLTEEAAQPAAASLKLEPFYLQQAQQSTTNSTSKPSTTDLENPTSKASRIGDTQKLPKFAPSEAESLKLQQEAEAKAQQQAMQKEQQEADAARIKLEQEGAKLMAEKWARAQASSQAKAEQATEEQTSYENTIQQAAESPPLQPVQAARRVRRKPLPLAKIAASLFILLLAMVAVLPYVWPMQGYVALVESTLSAQFSRPVHIAHIKASLLPLPKLELQDVSVGDARELKAASVVLNFKFSSIFSSTRAINNVDISKLELNSNAFAFALDWLHSAGNNAHYPVAHLNLTHASLTGDGISLPALNGKADWDSHGDLSKINLLSEDHKFDMQLQAQQARWKIKLRIKEHKLPWMPGILFSELNVKGEADSNSADFTEFDANLYGGTLSGSAHINWQDDWRMQGQMKVKWLDLQQAFPKLGIQGALDGDSSFMLSGASLPQLLETPQLDGTFLVSKGIINTIGIVETATNRKKMVGVRTHFDEMSGTVKLSNSKLQLPQLKISSGIMSANGSVDVSHIGQLSGRFSVNVKMRPRTVPLILSGTLEHPVLRPAN